MKELLFGAAYYDEYMPYDRLEKDIAMMKNDPFEKEYEPKDVDRDRT